MKGIGVSGFMVNDCGHLTAGGEEEGGVAVGKGKEGLGTEDGGMGSRADTVVVRAEAFGDDGIILGNEECGDEMVRVGDGVYVDGGRGSC